MRPEKFLSSGHWDGKPLGEDGHNPDTDVVVRYWTLKNRGPKAAGWCLDQQRRNESKFRLSYWSSGKSQWASQWGTEEKTWAEFLGLVITGQISLE